MDTCIRGGFLRVAYDNNYQEGYSDLDINGIYQQLGLPSYSSSDRAEHYRQPVWSQLLWWVYATGQPPSPGRTYLRSGGHPRRHKGSCR